MSYEARKVMVRGTIMTGSQREPKRFGRALITGASGGIGEAFARRLARDGSNLILVARRQDRLEALAEELRAAGGVDVEVLPADIGDQTGLRTVEQRVSEVADLDLLINNAGFPAYLPIAKLAPDVAENQIRLHLIATVRLSQAALPAMIARQHGAIINVSSALGFATPPGRQFGIYPATKAFLNTFSELLAGELDGTGVQVQALCPALVESEFHARGNVDVSQTPRSAFMAPDDVVQGSLAGLALGEVICLPALDDPNAVEEVRTARQRVFQGVFGKGLAGRYRG
jgi:short-subunit dehydrogenase